MNMCRKYTYVHALTLLMQCSGMAAKIPPRKKVKLHKEKNRANQNKAKGTMMTQLFHVFDKYRLGRAEAHYFLQDALSELGYEPDEEVNMRDTIEDQYKSLTQAQKRTLIPLLTHRDGAVNEGVLQCLPFLADRSRNLLQNPDRKVRDDKIDLTFISDFMHDHCR